jgi:hypothetical protein
MSTENMQKSMIFLSPQNWQDEWFILAFMEDAM